MADNRPSNEKNPPLPPTSSPSSSLPNDQENTRRRSSASEKLKQNLKSLTKKSAEVCSKAYCAFQGSLLDAGPSILAALKTAALGPPDTRDKIFIAVYSRPHGRLRDLTLGSGRYLWAFSILPREHREDLADGHLVHFEERIDQVVFHEVLTPELSVPVGERQRLLGMRHIGLVPEKWTAWNVFDIARRLVDISTVWECAQEEGRGYEWARLVHAKLDEMDFVGHEMPKGDFWRRRLEEADRWLDEQERADRVEEAAAEEDGEEGGEDVGKKEGEEGEEEEGEEVEEGVGQRGDEVEKEVGGIEFV
ncbi:hypothetical protein LTS18_011070 [Coniosporium uncinatum]|uniref:Uncharacterized protein n=1 Tax=Coniosporium uncinatum TaxID=93489 RepID=A0ACC3CZ12_9PEZI|nr:hypothetical protein LTS18_011070 [Coniosporium uncinatum]